jgi:hypothetical protein
MRDFVVRKLSDQVKARLDKMSDDEIAKLAREVIAEMSNAELSAMARAKVLGDTDVNRAEMAVDAIPSGFIKRFIKRLLKL